MALGSHQWLIYPPNPGSRGKKLLTQAPGMKSRRCSKQNCPLYVPSKNVALRSGSGEGRRLSFINSTAGVLPIQWLIMLLVNYGESCWLILGTVSFLQYMVLCTHPPLQGPYSLVWSSGLLGSMLRLSLDTRSLPLHNISTGVSVSQNLFPFGSSAVLSVPCSTLEPVRFGALFTSRT